MESCAARLTKSCCFKHSPRRLSCMWRIVNLLTCLIAGAMSEAKTTTLTLLEDLSSTLPTVLSFHGKTWNGA
jgi:hypothetical protein